MVYSIKEFLEDVIKEKFRKAVVDEEMAKGNELFGKGWIRGAKLCGWESEQNLIFNGAEYC